jgi:hypothetical protein
MKLRYISNGHLEGMMKIKLVNNQRQTLWQRTRGASGYRKGDSGVIHFHYGWREDEGQLAIKMFDGGYLILDEDVQLSIVGQ